MLADFALFVADAALYRGAGAEHATDGLAQCLGAVQDSQHALLDIEATFDQVGEQRRRRC
jgi:hypothetical protein